MATVQKPRASRSKVALARAPQEFCCLCFLKKQVTKQSKFRGATFRTLRRDRFIVAIITKPSVRLLEGEATTQASSIGARVVSKQGTSDWRDRNSPAGYKKGRARPDFQRCAVSGSTSRPARGWTVNVNSTS